MQGTVHLLVGAAIASVIPNPVGMFIAAFFSHYILDLLPHIDPETFTTHDHPYTGIQKVSLAIDVILVIALLTAMYWLSKNSGYILLGAIAAQLPDLLMPLERYQTFYPLYRMHTIFHWNKDHAKYWDWYIFGLVNPIWIGAGALYIIWSFA